MKQKYRLSEIKNLKIDIKKPSLIFLRGDLGVGKTTLTQHIVSHLLGIDTNVLSPTYTYYNMYQDVYHFDLYRLEKYDEFFAIGGEEILDNNIGVVIVEWPELLEYHYNPDIDITLTKISDDQREIEIIYGH